MTARERKASARIQDATAPEARPHVDPPSSELQSAFSSLERIFQNAAPEERDRLLTLARNQGLLFSHQLPQAAAAQNGSQSPLAQFLSGRHTNWSPSRIQPFEPEDAELDADQREAVAKALQSPDVCLIQGLPGTGKRRVAAEIIRQTAMRGQRVLLLAPRTGALDALLERVAGAASVLPVRCLNRDEIPEELPAPIRRLTFAAHVATLREQALNQARREAMAAEASLDRARHLEPQWTRLQELAGALARFVLQEESLTQRKEQLTDAVRQDANVAESNGAIETSFQKNLIEALTPLRAELAAADGACEDVRRKIAALERDQQQRETLLVSLRPLVEAKRQGRWWTPLWWRATFSGSRLNQFAEIEAATQLGRTDLDKQKVEAEELFQEEARRRNALDWERSRLVELEMARCRAELEREEAELRRDKAALGVSWAEVHRQIGLDATAPEAANPESARQAREAWQAKMRQEEEQAAFARAWSDALSQEARHLGRYLREGANLVAATPTALAADNQFGDSVSPPTSFDVLLLLEAHDVAEAEIVRIAGRANRIVLMGDPVAAFESEDSVPRRAKPGAPRPTVAPRGSLFQRLWCALHCDPRRLPYAWIWEGEQLCCRLRPVTAEQRRWVEKESVADIPEIELRILAQPRQPPVLIEVLFPRGYSIQQAKEYIVRELEELPVSTNGASLRWDERPEHIVLRLADASLPHAETVVLDRGVREMIGSPAEGPAVDDRPASWQTCCIEFDRAAGWQRQNAEEWVQRRLGLVDLGRTKRLNHPYRMQPDLAELNGAGAFPRAFHLRQGGWT